MSVVSVIVDAALVHNVVLVYFLGLCPAIGMSKRRDGALGMGLATTVVLTLATLLGWLLERTVLLPLGLGFLKILSFIMVIAAVVQLLELSLKRFAPPLYSQLGVYLPLITTNCAVLGAALLNSREGRDLVTSLAVGFGSGLGFLAVMVVFAGLRERLSRAQVPHAFEGTPVAFLTAGILSLALMGFEGMGGH